ncbi:MAG: gene transfer agent family protein [Alphaproteobacteria bacterium]|nr:gene transfer agent family protein [Alphaproteobacteria bacterium]
MVNKIRGEAALKAGGRQYRLLLTLGALAEIESGLGLEDLAGVAARLKQARAGDLAIVAAALLRGGGHDLCPAEVLRLECDLGELVSAVTAAFENAGLAAPTAAEGREGRPFAGSASSASVSA